MENEINEPGIRGYAMLALVTGTTAFGAYQLAKLGYDHVAQFNENRKTKNTNK